eukprot:TRINITY_DN763_c0_g3_i2.p1 TRINITY_DN763_c0_g3~~TRINITY_DN763_c0_g3_i2.p1  ORF type:complete len:217 (+),score=21.32 TRINITY_DN763_c0_g3_i2:245-895(+)
MTDGKLPPLAPSVVADYIKTYDNIPVTTISADAIIAAETGTPCPDWGWVNPQHVANTYTDPPASLDYHFQTQTSKALWYHSYYLYRMWYKSTQWSNVHQIYLLLFNHVLLGSIVADSELSERYVRHFLCDSLPRDCWLVELQSFDDKGDIIYNGSVPHDATVFSLRELRGSCCLRPEATYRILLKEPVRRPEPEAPVFGIDRDCMRQRIRSSPCPR